MRRPIAQCGGHVMRIKPESTVLRFSRQVAHRKNDDIQIKVASLSVARLPGLSEPSSCKSEEGSTKERKSHMWDCFCLCSYHVGPRCTMLMGPGGQR